MKVHLTADAEKQFQKLPKPERSKVLKKLQLLTENPQAGKKISRRIRGATLTSRMAVPDYLCNLYSRKSRSNHSNCHSAPTGCI